MSSDSIHFFVQNKVNVPEVIEMTYKTNYVIVPHQAQDLRFVIDLKKLEKSYIKGSDLIDGQCLQLVIRGVDVKFMEK
uniref:Fn3_like domain-containing protein n=1 Tax=Strongyloides venezuelensis TaxID=75913 RepID=A0A0K0G5E4_STRVS